MNGLPSENQAPPFLNNSTTSITPSVILSDEEIIKRKQKFDFQLKLAGWLIISTALIAYRLIFLKLDNNDTMLFIIFSIIGFALLIGLEILGKNKDFSQDAKGLQRFLFTLLTIMAVLITGDLNSPFFFFLFIIPIMFDFTPKFASPIAIAFFISILMGFGTILFENMTRMLLENPIRHISYLASPLLIAYFFTSLKLKTVNQKEEDSKITEFIQNLSLEHHKYKDMLESIQDGVISVNANGEITYSNRKAMEILNTSWSLMQNKNIQEFIPVNKLQEKPDKTFEFTRQSLDAEPVVVSMKVFNLLDNPYQKNGKIIVIRDITKHREFEDMKFDFVTMSAHQLRTPLTSIRNYLSVLMQTASPKLNQEEQMFLTRTIQSTDYLASLVDNLLRVSNIEHGMLKISFRPIDMSKIIQHTLGHLWNYAQQKNVTLRFEQKSQTQTLVSGDAYLLSEVVMHLVKNGIDYNIPGGQVTVSLQADHQKVVVYVVDTGKGISPEESKYLFNKFYRASHSLTVRSKGSGLGLYLSKKIIDAHNGKIWSDSIVGKGSTFAFSLPLYESISKKTA